MNLEVRVADRREGAWRPSVFREHVCATSYVEEGPEDEPSIST